MGTSERREREKRETRGRIVDAARRLFAEEGYEAVSMRRIADAIEYTPTAIYVHFKDKADLFHEICRCDFLRLAGAAQRLRDIPDPVERIAALGRAYIRFGVQHPNHYRLMFMTPHDHQPDATGAAHQGDPDEDSYALLKGSVEQGLAERRFRGGLTDANLISQTLWAAVHGVTSLAITKADDAWVDWAPLEARIDAMVESIVGGMTTPPKARPARASTGARTKAVSK